MIQKHILCYALNLFSLELLLIHSACLAVVCLSWYVGHDSANPCRVVYVGFDNLHVFELDLSMQIIRQIHDSHRQVAVLERNTLPIDKLGL